LIFLIYISAGQESACIRTHGAPVFSPYKNQRALADSNPDTQCAFPSMTEAMPTFSVASLRKAGTRLFLLIRRASPTEKTALLLIALIAAALFGFAELADDMMEGDTREFDEFVLLAFRSQADLDDPLGPAWVEEMMRDFTALGGVGVLTLLTLIVVGFLALARKRRAALLVTVAVVGGILLSSMLKWGFARPRPDLVPHIGVVYTQSFPSGHSMLSAVVYLTLGALLARTQASPRLKIYLLGVSAAATLVVGISRVYLGVHWPTDVLAGWALGAGWAMLCWLAMLWLQGRGTVEPETAEDRADAVLPATRMGDGE
jgi:undecaprenyl-diphosphatase